MSLMSGLFVGATGLQTSQNSLHTTAHNLSNIETPGYVRQQTLHADMTYNNIANAPVSKMQIGLGVEYDIVRQVRDEFLDKSYRKETGRSSFYEICQETTQEIETLLGEFDGVAFQDSIADLWVSVQELQKDPLSAVTKGSFVNNAAQFIERAQAVYKGLMDYQDNLNARVNEFVDRINDLADEIHVLNEKIHKEELGEQEANDLRDQRNKALDELSTLGNISYFTNADGATEVLFEGVSLVARDRVFHMDTIVEEGTGFYTPVWPQNMNTEVFIRDEEIATEFNTDIGELKAIILQRGDRRANYTDMRDDPDNADRPYANGSYRYSETELPEKLIPTSKSVVMKVQAELDSMVHSLMTEVNNILTGEKDAIDAYNKSGPTKDESLLPKYKKTDVDNGTIDLPKELFVRLGTSRYEVKDIGGTEYYVYKPEADYTTHADIDSLYTISNMKINPDLLKTPSLLGDSFLTDQKEVDHAKADALVDAFNKPFSTLTPDLATEYDYRDFYSALVGQIATEGSVYDSIVTAQQAAVHNLSDSRDSIMGVSSNEELTNMIKYQNAYNAASRYITACNDMLENLIQNLA
ncbi:MAG: flagellar hook-associated protein FlgK [Lachnospiraceae bacterium]|nr:flagellar hook-associated protein FlgK [Lachnospiraceae bacterium]